MKNKIFIGILGVVFTSVVLFLNACQPNEVAVPAQTEDVANSQNMEEFLKLADAIDHIDVKSKTAIDDQMVSYLDKKYMTNYSDAYAKMILEKK